MSPPVGQSERSKPWGWKVTIHAYGEGTEPTPASMIEAANTAAKHIGAHDFVDVDCKAIKKRPSDQGGS